MKTPWRFIADLVSRNPATDDEKTPEATVVPGAPVHNPEPEEAHAPSHIEAVPETSDRDAAAGDARPSPLSEDGSKIVAATASVEQGPAKIAAPTSVISKASKRKQPEKDPVVAPQKLATTAENAVPTAIVPKTHLEAMLELDAEIADLRMRLAEKLAEQNRQLTALVERYN